MSEESRAAEYYVTYETDEDGYFIASCPSINGGVAAGAAPEEAYRNIRDAIESCLEALEKVRKPIPQERIQGVEGSRVQAKHGS